MTVRELIAKLQAFDGEMEVVNSQPPGRFVSSRNKWRAQAPVVGYVLPSLRLRARPPYPACTRRHPDARRVVVIS